MAGVHTYNVADQPTDFDARLRDRLNGISPDETNPDTCSADTLKKFHDHFDATKQAIAHAQEGATAFLVAHPEFEDTKANSNQLVALAKACFGVEYPTQEMLEHVYPRLVAQGLLKLNDKKLKEQADDKAKITAKEQESLTEEEQYSFDLADLRLVSNGHMTPGEARRRHIEARRQNGIFG